MAVLQSLELVSIPDEVEERFHANESKIRRCMCVAALVPFLCEGATLLSFEEGQSLLNCSQSEGTETLLRLIKEKGSTSYSTFLDCLQRENTHLGHAYICALLEGRKYASENDIARSKSLKDVVVKNFSDFTAGVNLIELFPYMCEYQLLTEHEKEHICDTTVSNIKRIMFLFCSLNTKGPLAYTHFANCLRKEDSHPTHRELYAVMRGVVDEAQTLGQSRSRKHTCRAMTPEGNLCKKVPGRFVICLHGVLRGKQYEELMVKFQACHHNGEWMNLEAEAKSYLTDSMPYELQIVAHLEVAVSWIFRRQKNKAIAHVSKAGEMCRKVQGDNSTILHGRCEYILSRLFRYLKDYREAKKHAEKAKVILYNVERGEDSAFANYCDACVMVDNPQDNANIKDIEDCFGVAIDNARRHHSGLDLVAPHSFMRLAQMYLGSTHYSAGSVKDTESIRKAENCLQSVDLSSLPIRSRCHFHLTKSDLFQSKGLLSDAARNARYALDVSRKHNFTNEITSAENRL